MRSSLVKDGVTRATQRSLLKATGLSNEDLKKPLIGVVNSFNEVNPGHVHLREIAEEVKLGIAAAGGVGLEPVCAIPWPAGRSSPTPSRPWRRATSSTPW